MKKLFQSVPAFTVLIATFSLAAAEHYGKVVQTGSECGCGPACCTPEAGQDDKGASAIAHALGYSAAETNGVPQGANHGLGCGNPLAIASLKTGQTVLDWAAARDSIPSLRPKLLVQRDAQSAWT